MRLVIVGATGMVGGYVLLASGFPGVYIFRPACIYPAQSRKEPNLRYRVMRAIYPAFGCCSPIKSFGPTIWPGPWWTSSSALAKNRRALFLRTVTSELSLGLFMAKSNDRIATLVLLES